MAEAYTHENDVDDYVKDIFKNLGLKKHKDYNEQRECSDYLKTALQGSSKTKQKTGAGIPDFTIEKYTIDKKKGKTSEVIPVLIEDKIHLSRLKKAAKNSRISLNEKDVSTYAVNGAIFYATNVIKSGKYHEAIAIGIAGDSADDIRIEVYFVYGSSELFVKKCEAYTSLNFLQNEQSFNDFYKYACLTETEKHKNITDLKIYLQDYSKKLNVLMHSLNITAPQRVLYVSGMLLAMQDYTDNEGKPQNGLITEDLTEKFKAGELIYSKIESFLKVRIEKENKRTLVLKSFDEIRKDPDRDTVAEKSSSSNREAKNHKLVADILSTEACVNKQIFAFIYEYIFKKVLDASYVDIMGEMYSEFLKYALGDGKELGIVLTPPYVTKMMSQILDVNKDSRVMDLATGSAGFLISSMVLMEEDTNNHYSKGTIEAEQKIKELKKNQLLGVEYNAEMFALACTNMILRGDGSSNIQKANTFQTPPELYQDFKATKLLLNPPFTWEGNGMPFIEFGLNNMQKGGLGAIIIQDSAGNGQAVNINQKILAKHTLKASIKMPIDLFQPMAGVQTSIYVFEAGTPHDFYKTVKFIDFRNDGYKRTGRGLQELDKPEKRYQDIIKIYKGGKAAKVDPALWDLDSIYIEDLIADENEPNFCADWNFEQHQQIDTTPTEQDFMNTVKDYLSWKVSCVLKGEANEDDNSNF